MWTLLVAWLFLPHSTAQFIRFDWEHVDQSVLDAEPDLKAFLHCTQKCKYSDTCSGIIWDEHKPTAEKCSFKYDVQDDITISKNGVCPTTPATTIGQLRSSSVTTETMHKAKFTMLPDEAVETAQSGTTTKGIGHETTSEDDVGTEPSEVETTTSKKPEISSTTPLSSSSTMESQTMPSELMQETKESTTTVLPSPSTTEIDVATTDRLKEAVGEETATEATTGSISHSASTVPTTVEGPTLSIVPRNDNAGSTNDTTATDGLINRTTITTESDTSWSVSTSSSSPVITNATPQYGSSTMEPTTPGITVTESEPSTSLLASTSTLGSEKDTAAPETNATMYLITSGTSTGISDSTSSQIALTTTTRPPTTTTPHPFDVLKKRKTATVTCTDHGQYCYCRDKMQDLRVTLLDGTYYTATTIQFNRTVWTLKGINSGSATNIPASVKFGRVDCLSGRSFRNEQKKVYTFVIKNGHFSKDKVLCRTKNGFHSSDGIIPNTIRVLDSVAFKSFHAVVGSGWYSNFGGGYSIGRIICT